MESLGRGCSNNHEREFYRRFNFRQSSDMAFMNQGYDYKYLFRSKAE